MIETDSTYDNWKNSKHENFLTSPTHFLFISKTKFERSKDLEKVSEIELALIAFQTTFTWEVNNQNEIKGNQNTIFSEENLKYYEVKINEEISPILKSRYNELLYEIKKNHNYALSAIQEYLDSLQIYYEAGSRLYFKLMNYLDRAFELSLKLNNVEYIDKVIAKYYEFIDLFDNNNEIRYFLEIIRSLLKGSKHKKSKDKINYDFLIIKLEKSIDFYDKEGNLPLQREFLFVLETLHRCCKNKDEGNKIKVRVAESFIKEAESRKIGYDASHFVASMFYEQAMREYSDLGNHEKAQELQVKIQEANKYASKNEAELITSSFEIPKIMMDNFLKSYKGTSIINILKLMTQDINLNPSFNEAKNLSIEQNKKFIAHLIAPIHVMRDGIRVAAPSGEEENLEHQANNNFHLSIELISAIFLPALFRIIKIEHEKYIDEIYKHFSNSPIISTERLHFIKEGLEYFGKQEFLASIHILLFQIEGILRDFFVSLFLPTFQYKQKEAEMREKLFSKLIEDLSELGLDPDLIKFIELLFSNMSSFNYRNNIAHGLITNISIFSEKLSLLLIFILIKLSFYRVEKINDNYLLTDSSFD